ncbi:MAG: spore coat protein CotJB [Clostridiales bacterium]|nr:spore coat protein CotJB [Clostridiales bacterium]
MNKYKLLKRVSSTQFAMYEVRLFLDTHPDDADAQALYDSYKKKFESLKEEYEKQFGPLTLNGYNSDEWLKNPWPWDNSANE